MSRWLYPQPLHSLQHQLQPPLSCPQWLHELYHLLCLREELEQSQKLHEQVEHFCYHLQSVLKCKVKILSNPQLNLLPYSVQGGA